MTTLDLTQDFVVPVGVPYMIVPFTGEVPEGFTLSGGVLTAIEQVTVQVTANIEWRASSDLGGSNVLTGYRVVSIARNNTTVQSDLDDSHAQFEVTRQSVGTTVECAPGDTVSVRVSHDYSKPLPVLKAPSTSLTVVQVVESFDDVGADPAGAAEQVRAELDTLRENLQVQVDGLAGMLDSLQDQVNTLTSIPPFDLPTGLADLTSAVVGTDDAALSFYGTPPVTRQPELTPAETSGVDVVSVLGVSVLGGQSANQVNNHTTRINEIEARLQAYGLLK